VKTGERVLSIRRSYNQMYVEESRLKTRGKRKKHGSAEERGKNLAASLETRKNKKATKGRKNVCQRNGKRSKKEGACVAKGGTLRLIRFGGRTRRQKCQLGSQEDDFLVRNRRTRAKKKRLKIRRRTREKQGGQEIDNRRGGEVARTSFLPDQGRHFAAEREGKGLRGGRSKTFQKNTGSPWKGGCVPLHI